MTLQKIAVWRGRLQTADHVRKVIAERYGQEEAKNYDPQVNCFTLPTWNKLGFRIKKGEKAIRSLTLVEEKDPNAQADAKEGEQAEGHKYPKTVYLFYITQVEKKKE